MAPVVIPGLGTTAIVLSIAEQPDGKIVLTGDGYQVRGEGPAFVARFGATGAIDQKFGSAGAVVNPIPGLSRAVLLQPDGDIVIAGGDPSSPDTAVARFTPRGAFDNAFGLSGVALYANLVSSAYSIALQTDGKLLLLGSRVARLLPNGHLDSTITGGKIATIAHSFPGTFENDGNYLITSQQNTGGPHDDFVVETTRYLRNSQLDATWNTIPVDFGYPGAYFSFPEAIAVAPNGDVAVLGGDDNNGRSALGLVRYLPNGKLDPTFAQAGKLYQVIGLTDFVGTLAIQPDAKIVVAITAPTSKSTLSILFVARYLAK